MKECRCEIPEPKINRTNRCVKCAGSLETDWACNDRTLGQFLDRLGDTIPVKGEGWEQFRLHVEAREAAGRSTFRQTFLGKNLLHEAREEATDLALYMALHAFQRLRDGQDQNMDLLLTVAHHAYLAYVGTIELHHKEQGAP